MSSTFAAPAPTAASLWRRAAASRRTARRSLAACPRIGATFCWRASTWPCARSWGAIRGGATRRRIARICASRLWFTLSFLLPTRKGDQRRIVYSRKVAPRRIRTRSLRTARLRPRPARPSCAPTAERPPAPHACSTRLAVLRVCCWEWRFGGSTWRCMDVVASLPWTSRKKRASAGDASCSHRACDTAAHHARPHAVRLRAHRVSRSASCKDSVLPFGDAPCVCFNGRENRSRGRPVSTARKATRDCHDFASMSTVRWHPRGESERRRSKGSGYKFGVTGG
jgi:hypothetical protein